MSRRACEQTVLYVMHAVGVYSVYMVRTAKKGLWARPPVLMAVPSLAIHSLAWLNSHHSDIQLSRNHFISKLFEAIEKKKFLTVWVPGTGGQDMEARVRAKDTRDNGHVRHQRDDVI